MSITNHVHHHTRVVTHHESQLVDTEERRKAPFCPRHDQPPETHVGRKGMKAPFCPMCEAGFICLVS